MGPRRHSPWRNALVVCIIAVIILLICLIVLGLTSDFLVDWLWFSEIGYPGVFWTTILAQAATFCAAFLATVLILWANGALAYRLARSPWARLPDLGWERGGVATPPDPLEVIRHHSRWPFVIGCGASLIAILVSWGQVHNWSVFLRFFYQIPSGATDPIYGNDIGFYLFSLPAFIAIRNWMLLTLFLSALFAGAVYWVQGHITYDAQRRDVLDRHCSWLRSAGALFCRESVVLWSRSLPTSLRR
jgi:uncharacterized membrane protein (UPF0182 family)